MIKKIGIILSGLVFIGMCTVALAGERGKPIDERPPTDERPPADRGNSGNSCKPEDKGKPDDPGKPDNPGKPTGAVLAHCGCSVTDEGLNTAYSELRWSVIIVSEKSKGHKNHLATDVVNCAFADDTEVEKEEFFMRSGDCQEFDILQDVPVCETMPVHDTLCEYENS